VSGSPGGESPERSTSRTKRCPVASMRRSSVETDGSLRPDSYALITLRATFARRATSVCDSRALTRARFKSSPALLFSGIAKQ
jgi:hypothetical protein